MTDHREADLFDMYKILIVDDTPLNLRQMELILHKSEFTICVATNGQEALARARAEKPFLIISDIQMPEMNGFELCEQIKSDPATRQMGVILITAHEENAEHVSWGLNIGADDFIFRPVQVNELRARVRAVARLKRAELSAQQQARIVTRRNEELALLNELSVATTTSLDLAEVVALSLKKLEHLCKSESASIWLLNQKRQTITAYFIASAGRVMSIELPFETSGQDIELLLQEQLPSRMLELLAQHQIGFAETAAVSCPGIICIPMIYKAQTLGAVAITNKREGQFSTEDWTLLNSAINIINVAVENARLFSQVQALNRSLEEKVVERTQRLVEEKEKIEAILANMSDGVLVLDGEQQVVTANAALQEMVDLPLNRFCGRSILAAELTSPLWAAVRQLLDQPALSSLTVDLSEASAPDEATTIQVSAAQVRMAGEVPLGRVFVFSDVTALTRVERMKARFMSGVTHELKTPVAVIRLHAENLARYHARLPEQKRTDLLQAIQSQTVLLEGLVEEILALSQLDAGAVETRRERIDLWPLATEVVDKLRPLAEEKQIRLRWLEPSRAVALQGDPEQISRLISNLLSNAIKYTPAAGAVEVEAGQEAVAGRRLARLRVSDTGIGIAPAEQSRIFDRFYRVDKAHTIPGTGLGLSLVKEIVAAHGGEIRFESQPQRGSTFEVLLPCD